VRIYITDIIYVDKLDKEVKQSSKILLCDNSTQYIFLLHDFFINLNFGNSKSIDKLEITWDAEKVLNNFCYWQHELRRSKNMHAAADMVLLLTK
jgi:hypothetical protein